MGVWSTAVIVRLLVAFVLCYALGFERELRGSPAGDRTFSLIGVSTALIGFIAGHGAPNVVSGAITGVGFIGGGILLRQALKDGAAVLHGLTTAAAILAAAAIGVAAGDGFLLAAVLGTVLILLILEIQHIPGLRVLDARRWSPRFANDEPSPHTSPHPPRDDEKTAGS